MSESEVNAPPPIKPLDEEITLDQADAWGFGGLSNQFSVPERGIKMPVDRDSETYNMNHRYGNMGGTNGLWSFQTADLKLERFLPKNQHTQRKLLNFEFWINGELSKSAKIFMSKIIRIFTNFFFIEEY